MRDLREMLLELNDEFCIEEFEKFVRNQTLYADKTRILIDELSPPLKYFLVGLEKLYGIKAVLGAVTILTLLLNREENLRENPINTAS